MKTLLSIAAALVMSMCIVGCTSNDKIQIVHNDTVVTNTVPMKAFNDESYVWEMWLFGTNKVEKLETK